MGVVEIPEVISRKHTDGHRGCWCDKKPLPAELDVHAALNTYETPDRAPGFREGAYGAAEVVGANGRRLLARRMPEGLWIGGCLISDPDTIDALRAYLVRELQEMTDGPR